jgi:hypothetical protein
MGGSACHANFGAGSVLFVLGAYIIIILQLKKNNQSNLQCVQMGCTGSKSAEINIEQKSQTREEIHGPSSEVPKNVALLASTQEVPLDSDPVDFDDFIESLQRDRDNRGGEKIKLLLLGTGESGKSTIFKQYRILYGSPKTDEDLRFYGVIVRSNIINAIRKLCLLIRTLEWEKRLDEESAAATAADFHDVSGMSPREAYDQICEYIVDNTATEPFPEIPKDQEEKDWIGKSNRAGIQANLDAHQFLKHVEAIRVLWQVSDVWIDLLNHVNSRVLTNISDCRL